MGMASRTWLLFRILLQAQSRSDWEMAWAALAAQLRSPWTVILIQWRSEISMGTASRTSLLPTQVLPIQEEQESRSAWENACQHQHQPQPAPQSQLGWSVGGRCKATLRIFTARI